MCNPFETILLNPHTTLERRGHVNVCWFSQEFSQSRLGGTITGGSNACTLIAILVAQKCYQNSIKVKPYEGLSHDIINALGESIIQGNEIHKRLTDQGALSNVNLTVPEAIVAAGPGTKFLSEWKSFIFLLDLRATLFAQLSEIIHEWYRNPPPLRGSDLFVILIAENRSVLLVFHNETSTVALIDSHSHLNHGAVIAYCPLENLNELCLWYCTDIMERCYHAQPTCYELTFLYFKKLDSGEGAHNK